MTLVRDALNHDAIDAADSLLTMAHKELTLDRSCYLDESASVTVTASDRSTVAQWCYSITELAGLKRTNVLMAMEMTDRFLSKPRSETQQCLNCPLQFQLLAIAALYSAIKVNESVILDSDAVSKISAAYTKEEIETMELTLLHGLEWRIYAPTSIQIAHDVLSLLQPRMKIADSSWEFILDEVEYQTECAVLDHYFSKERQSTIALAAIWNAIEQLNYHDCQQATRDFQALLAIMEDDFALYNEIDAAKNRLQTVVEHANGPLIEDGIFGTSSTDISISASDLEESFITLGNSSLTRSRNEDEDDLLDEILLEDSPRTVTYSHEDEFLGSMRWKSCVF